MPFRRALIAVVTATAFGAACGATAQDGGDDQAPGVVVQVQHESTTRNVMSESLAKQAGAAGIDGTMLASIFGQLTGALEGGLAEAPGLSDMLPANLMTKVKVAGHVAGHEIGRGLRDAATPDRESSKYTVYIRPDMYRLEADGFSMLWKPAGAGGSAGMWVGDPATGQLTAVDLGQVDAAVGDGARHTGMEITPLPGGPTREILGTTARGYSYRYTLDLSGNDIPGMEMIALMISISVQNVIEGEAWLAPDLPDADEIMAFFRNFAAGFGGREGMMGGVIGGMAALAELGVPLETRETIQTYLIAPLGNQSHRIRMIEGTSSSRVTDISSGPLAADLFVGADGFPDTP